MARHDMAIWNLCDKSQLMNLEIWYHRRRKVEKYRDIDRITKKKVGYIAPALAFANTTPHPKAARN